jgi:hypothetical protein
VVSGNHLHAPWGMELAPSNFGEFSGDLLVANTGDGRINAFDPATGRHEGQLRDPSGKPVDIDGLWGLDFGNGFSSGDSNALYFSAAPDNHQHGLFGSLRVAPDGTVSPTMSRPDHGAPAHAGASWLSEDAAPSLADEVLNAGGASVLS